MRRLAAVLALAGMLFALPALADTPVQRPCGYSPSDWCPSPQGDPCGAHKDRESCKADPRCRGMAYRGESFMACFNDPRGFPSNCPVVGCVSGKPRSKE